MPIFGQSPPNAVKLRMRLEGINITFIFYKLEKMFFTFFYVIDYCKMQVLSERESYTNLLGKCLCNIWMFPKAMEIKREADKRLEDAHACQLKQANLIERLKVCCKISF